MPAKVVGTGVIGASWVALLDGSKIRRLDTFISDVAMLNSYFVEERTGQVHQ